MKWRWVKHCMICIELAFYILVLTSVLSTAYLYFFFNADTIVYQQQRTNINSVQVIPMVFEFDRVNILPDEVTANYVQTFCPVSTRPRMPSHSPTDLNNIVDWSAEKATNHLTSTATILNLKSTYKLCDELTVRIQARNMYNEPKTFGGDYFRVNIYSFSASAGAGANSIVDHTNGTYTAYFTAWWPGTIIVQVILVHSSEAVQVIRNVRQRHPQRYVYFGMFATPAFDVHEVTMCHVKMDAPKVCNLTDAKTGSPWFCIAPAHPQLTCSDWRMHTTNSTMAMQLAYGLVTKQQANLFNLQYKFPLQCVHYYANVEDTLGEKKLMAKKNLPKCIPGLPLIRPSGYYYSDIWYSNVCRTHQFSIKETERCLRNKNLVFYGDSTIRQWFEFLTSTLSNTIENTGALYLMKVGPRQAYDSTRNISLFYHHHAFPIRNSWMYVSEIHYAANEIDLLPSSRNTVICICLWAHFTATSVQYYRSRLLVLRAAIERYHARSPDSLVVIKSANTREHPNLSMSLYTSDWLAEELDREMRDIFSGYQKAVIIDAWDMTASHNSRDRVHPPEIIIANEINILLSYICPEYG